MKFLDLCQYFHTHVRDMSTLIRPLSMLIHEHTRDSGVKYSVRQRAAGIIWDDEGRLAFQKLKKAIDNLPLLYFIVVGAPVFIWKLMLVTTVLVVYQIIEGDSRTVKIIEFFSKFLSGPMKNWSTPDKEAYGMYYAFVKYDYLLNNSKFIL